MVMHILAVSCQGLTPMDKWDDKLSGYRGIMPDPDRIYDKVMQHCVWHPCR